MSQVQGLGAQSTSNQGRINGPAKSFSVCSGKDDVNGLKIFVNKTVNQLKHSFINKQLLI